MSGAPKNAKGNPLKDVAILILAAGASSRMRGSDKLLEKVDTKPILHQIAAMAVATGCPVFVALPVASPNRLGAVSGLAVTQLEVEDADLGLSASIRAGIGVLPKPTKGVMLMLADMPDLTRTDLLYLLDAFTHNPDQVIRASDITETPGHPIIFPARLFPDLMRLTGQHGARAILSAETVRHIPLPDQHATNDLDTPEQWLAWRKANPFRN